MDAVHVEKYPGKNGHLFMIRIFDYTNKFETAINLLVDGNEDEERNIKRYDDPADSELKDLIEKAKNTIILITITP